MGRPFPYEERAARVRAAWAAIGTAFAAVTNRRDEADPRTIAWRRAVETAWTSIDGAYPPGFDEAYRNVRKGKAGGIDLLVEFLEADPIFFRSGYVKAQLIAQLKRAKLEAGQAERLRGVVKRIVLSRDEREFRHFCRLAHHVDTPGFRDDLRAIAAGPDKDRRRRATWMLAALEQAERTARGKTESRKSLL